ncbi:MAG: putative lipoprotein [Alphaproteobacteria bacterium]|jgi:outer membrane protein assembly factor BamD|nr:putative lipoprotein [Alphaproteobacteria bacterium]
MAKRFTFVPQNPSPARAAVVACLFSALLLTGCTTKEEREAAEVAKEKQVAVEILYNKARETLEEGEYFKAALRFDDVDRQYPYSQWATRAQLMSGYAHYKNLKYPEAVLALDRFIELHPGDQNIAYAYYLRALCYYEQISDVRRDQRMTQLALDNLRQVVERYPDSKYARDAALKIDLTQDHLAGKEMEIGRYYLERRQYHAAIPRFQRVLDNYQTTTHVPEALHRMTEAYLSLGLKDEAQKTAAILGHNYPQSVWYKDSFRLFNKDYKEGAEPSMYERTIGKIF